MKREGQRERASQPLSSKRLILMVSGKLDVTWRWEGGLHAHQDVTDLASWLCMENFQGVLLKRGMME
jgi:hypothetical protein